MHGFHIICPWNDHGRQLKIWAPKADHQGKDTFFPMPSRLPQHKDFYAEALETPQPPVNPECCTEKERLLNVWKRVALEIAEYTKTIVDERILTRGEYDSRKAATKRLWKACESARNTFQTHRSEHGC